MSICGPNRIGIVNDITTEIESFGGNIENSTMTKLDKQFTIMLGTTFNNQKPFSILSQSLISSIQAKNLYIQLYLDTSSESKGKRIQDTEWDNYAIEAIFPDKTGLLERFTHILSKHHIQIDNLESSFTKAPISGDSIFKIKAHVRIPTDISMTSILQEFEQIENAFGGFIVTEVI